MTGPLLKRKLEEKGFSDVVVVSEKKPTGFPLPGSADYYVLVSWNRNPKVFGVPDAVTSRKKVA